MNGRGDEARDLFASDAQQQPRLFFEEYDVAHKRLVGNFPQAFTHLVLVEAAKTLGSATAKAGRRPAAILFAELESSSALARRLSTASYFALGRRMARAADGCVIDAGGLVGRHVGDGVVAFFPPRPRDRNLRPRVRASKPREPSGRR